jgi:arsenate reductase-like glutaredoxin family protein
MQREPSQSSPVVYTFPECPKCDTLKTWFKMMKIEYEEKPFDTETQLEFIMHNIFGDPPILEFYSRIIPSEELFVGEVLDEMKIKEVIESEKT